MAIRFTKSATCRWVWVTGSLQVAGVVTIILLTSIFPSLIFAQTITDPTAQSNIHASRVANNFASGFVPGINNYDPNTKTNYYLIGPIDRGYEKGKTANLTTPNAANKIEKTPVVAPVSKTNPIQQVTNINNTTIITTNIYYLSSFIINVTNQSALNNNSKQTNNPSNFVGWPLESTLPIGAGPDLTTQQPGGSTTSPTQNNMFGTTIHNFNNIFTNQEAEKYGFS